MGSLHAAKNEEKSTKSIKDEDKENNEDQNITDHLVPTPNQNNTTNPKKRKREEKKENKKSLKKRKLSQLETKQELNYPESITWELLLNSLKRQSSYINFIKNEITDEKEKADFLDALKKIYNTNQTLLQNLKITIPLAKYFKKKYRTNIDKDMILINVLHKITSKAKEIEPIFHEMIHKFTKKSVTKQKINFIKKTIDKIEKEKKSPTLLLSIFNYILDSKNTSDKNVQTYVTNWEKSNTTIKKKKEEILLKTNTKEECSFLKFFNSTMNDQNKKYFASLSIKNQQIIKSILFYVNDDKKNILLNEIEKFHKKFPHLFKIYYKKSFYFNRQVSVNSMYRYFDIAFFYYLSDDQLKSFSDEYVSVLKEKLGKEWKKAIRICANLSFDKISLFYNLLSTIENPTDLMQKNLLHFANNMINISPPSPNITQKFKEFFPNISEQHLNNIEIVILYHATFNYLKNKNYSNYLNILKKHLHNTFKNLNTIYKERTNESKEINIIYSILFEFINNSKIKNPQIALYLAEIISTIETLDPLLSETFCTLLKRKINTFFSFFKKENNPHGISSEIRIYTNINTLQNTNNSIYETIDFIYKSKNIVNLNDDLQKTFKNYTPNIDEHITVKIPNLIFLYMRINNENIRATLDTIFRTLNQIVNDINQPNLTAAEQEEINSTINYFTNYINQHYDKIDEIKFYEECIENGIQKNNDEIYTQLQTIKLSLNRIYARLHNTRINYEDRQSVYTEASHKAADDMIQDLWKKFPLDDYKYNANKYLPYCNDDGTINAQKTKTLNDIGIENIFKSIVPDIDLNKHLFFLHEILNTPKDILNYIINYDENNSDNENSILLNSSYSEHEMSKIFHAYFIDYKNKFNNNPKIKRHEKDISFRELFNKACIHLQKECRFHEYGPVFSIEEIREYENAFLRYRAKKLLLSIAQNAKQKINEFSQPKKAKYSQGLFALLLRVILNIYETTPNQNDLKDKFLTLRNNLAYASLEYSLDQSACTFGQTYNILEQFLNMAHVNDVISINPSNFNQIFIALAQPEVERINASTGTTEDKLDQLKANIILALSDPNKYAQDFWQTIKNPLIQINEFVEGLREHFEDDNEITIEEEN